MLRARLLNLLFWCVTALLLSALVMGFFYQPNTQIPAGYTGRHVNVRGVQLRVLQQGQGRDLLLIHGSSGSIEDWQPLLSTLSQRHHVVAVDRPGHGFSADVEDHSYQHNAQLLLALVDTLGLNDVLVVGHSYGGVIGLLMAEYAPKQVSSVVVLDSATYQSARPATLQWRALSVPFLGAGLASLIPYQAKASMLRAGLSKEFKRLPSEQFFAQHEQIWSSPKVLHSLAAEIVDANENLALASPSYAQIRVPVHIVAQADDWFRRSSAQRLQRDIPGASLHLLSNTGHYVHHEQTAAVLEVIERAAAKPRTPAHPAAAKAR